VRSSFWAPTGLLFACLALAAAPAAITVDYPEDASIFPPEITPPTFLWRDAATTVTQWRIAVSFGDGSPAIHALSRGPRMRIGPLDPDCVSETNKPPTLTPQQAAAHTWTPSPALWQSIKKRSVAAPATVTITGLAGDRAISRGRVTIRTSNDPVGAPIFYRDVPLMPTETEKGVIQPLAAEAVRLIQWRLRNIAQPESRVVMRNVPMCANCHSFSRDGKTLGMDLDGLQKNRGLYTLTPVAARTSIAKANVIQWRTAQGELKGKLRVGFMSQVSPDGRYVVTTLNPADLDAPAAERPSNYYVANFKDYRFLQVFYPTRGILSWYSRETGQLQPLPGADDRRFVQTNAAWSPDGAYLVFARAETSDPNPPGAPPAKFANDPAERHIQYDLYRIPFNAGQGGAPEPVAGASRNGMSNTFPKVSPDGRWIVFVQCRNGLLMRPDSQLYIVPAAGGVARRMRCNTPLMNSWHSFSPNGRWLVFSSKSRSPYTQMYLTHLDQDGNDSPPILIDNSTAANRAVNIPEFVNIAPDGLGEIGGPAIDFYRLYDRAMYFQKRKRYEEAVAAWRQVLETDPEDVLANSNLAAVLLAAGRREEAALQSRKASQLKLRKAAEDNPGDPAPHNALGVLLLDTGHPDDAIAEFRTAIGLEPNTAAAHANLGRALAAKGERDQALAELHRALDLDPTYPPAHYHLGLALAAQGKTAEAIGQWREAVRCDPNYAEAHDALAAALFAQGETAQALAHWRAAIEAVPADVVALRHAAWILATSSQAPLRNGPEALAFAVRAAELSGTRDAAVLDALAAAYAETGRFADAVLTAQRALALADAAHAESLKRRLAGYQAGTAFRDR
jgi:tetratricopeptide (TPR) repeat protein